MGAGRVPGPVWGPDTMSDLVFVLGPVSSKLLLASSSSVHRHVPQNSLADVWEPEIFLLSLPAWGWTLPLPMPSLLPVCQPGHPQVCTSPILAIVWERPTLHDLTPSISESRFWFACLVVLFVWGLLVCFFWYKLAFIFSGQGADHFHTSQNKLAIIRPFGWYFSILYKCFLKLGVCLCVSECPSLNMHIWRPEHDTVVFLYHLPP